MYKQSTPLVEGGSAFFDLYPGYPQQNVTCQIQTSPQPL